MDSGWRNALILKAHCLLLHLMHMSMGGYFPSLQTEAKSAGTASRIASLATQRVLFGARIALANRLPPISVAQRQDFGHQSAAFRSNSSGKLRTRRADDPRHERKTCNVPVSWLLSMPVRIPAANDSARRSSSACVAQAIPVLDTDWPCRSAPILSLGWHQWTLTPAYIDLQQTAEMNSGSRSCGFVRRGPLLRGHKQARFSAVLVSLWGVDSRDEFRMLGNPYTRAIELVMPFVVTATRHFTLWPSERCKSAQLQLHSIHRAACNDILYYMNSIHTMCYYSGYTSSCRFYARGRTPTSVHVMTARYELSITAGSAFPDGSLTPGDAISNSRRTVTEYLSAIRYGFERAQESHKSSRKPASNLSNR